jgi:hypothetical protein
MTMMGFYDDGSEYRETRKPKGGLKALIHDFEKILWKDIMAV